MPTPNPPSLTGLYPHIPEPYRSNELWPAYYLAFGRFINQFGQTETTLSHHLEQFAQGLLGGGFGGERDSLISDVLRGLLGSRRIGDLAVSFKLCIKAWSRAGQQYDVSVLTEIEQLFAQVAQIRFLRDRTAHYGVQIQAQNDVVYFRTINRYTVNDLEKVEEILFRIEHLEQACEDLQTICMRLPFALGMHIRQGEFELNNPEHIPPWKYKPSELLKRSYPIPPIILAPSPPPTAWWTISSGASV